MELIIIILAIAFDRFSKILALGKLKNGNDIIIIKDYFSLSYLENRGAAWGIFQNKTAFLLVITSLIICGVIYYLFRYKPKDRILRISLSLIIGGAIGNMYDRAVYKYVVDFIYLHYKDIYSFPTFNVADICVVIGTVLLAVCVIRDDK